MASRSRPAALEPASSTSLNVLQGSPPPSKRRKVFHNDHEETQPAFGSTAAFSIHSANHSRYVPQPHGSSSSDDRLTLMPIALLPRSRLPLSWLDPCSSSSQRIQSGKLFVSNIPTLENPLRRRTEPAVLATKLVNAGRTSPVGSSSSSEDELYVVERVKQGIYAICSLGSWVEEGDLLVATKGWREKDPGREASSKESCTESTDGANWLEKAKISSEISGGFLGKRKPANVSFVFGPKGDGLSCRKETSGANSIDLAVDQLSQSYAPLEIGGETQQVLHPETDVSTVPNAPVPVPDQSAQEMFKVFRTQYMEALYISKTSVAYFVKGPLSRARAALHSTDEGRSFTPSDLCNFYRECIIPVKKMDHKYRESIPNAIKDIPSGLSDDDTATRTGKVTKRKKGKGKIGKNGLYPEENDFIPQWWKGRALSEATMIRESSREEETKRLVSDLRFRETQLQILLILEAISLEGSLNQASGERSLVKPQDGKGKKQSKKKTQDLNVLLELLADRLCIWHTVSFDELTVLEGGKNREQSKQSTAKESDKLKDFCTEVIIPFYAPRLPEQCKTISRKMGAPIAVSPIRPTRSQAQSGTGAQPGAAVKRLQPNKAKRTLQRVLTDEKIASKGRVPSLSRSSTAPSIPQLKRKSSEPASLSLIPGGRGGIQKAKRVDNREVDLDAVARQHEAKFKKMNMLLEQKRELDAAINALRKPNRELVTRDLADSVDRKAISSSSRKSKHPTRNPFAQGVQVMATPKTSRKKDCNVSVPSLHRDGKLAQENPAYSPPVSEIQVIPSSTARPSHFPQPRSLETGQVAPNSIHETPSKMPLPSSRARNSMADDKEEPQSLSMLGGPSFSGSNPDFAHLNTSPTLLRKTRSYPNLVRERDDGVNGQSTSKIQETPLKPAVSRLVPQSTATGYKAPTSNIQETPTKSRPLLTPHAGGHSTSSFLDRPGAIVFTTPIKPLPKETCTLEPRRPHTGIDATTVSATPEKSIYDHLGWDDDDDELALL
ncbi:hypothetical protein AJ80_06020 [Polytolypa hystricis UAMH7299]|uniref:DNA replication regulator Sld3 C-terminal domain-containing protein n=1 Tax=Polytolypa hystricis (strain UAMH7299) TaxID=1447883 RepID=A0A2B7XZE6_POLH7|nr:hypothetical protein AJ80_06020 [Polytolypa hystricis UAMH7299]